MLVLIYQFVNLTVKSSSFNSDFLKFNPLIVAPIDALTCLILLIGMKTKTITGGCRHNAIKVKPRYTSTYFMPFMPHINGANANFNRRGLRG